MFMIFNVCIYNDWKLLYHSTVHRVYIHGIDMSQAVHVYAMWSGFQMAAQALENHWHDSSWSRLS